MSREALASTPDGVGSPDWVMDVAERARAPVAGRDTPPRERPDARDQRRSVVDASLAAKLLGAHLSNRSQLMPIRPTDLSGLDEERATLLIRAMAAAGHADGGVAADELARLEERAHASAISGDRIAALLAELREPPSIEALVRQVADAPTAERFYAVSAWVIRRDEPTCRAYLDYLAVRLGLAGDVRIRLDGDVETLAGATVTAR
ncbi:DUF533 domain-containing protein [Sphingomonas rubra]|uniref:Tellurite resistance protein TerB n=1 Tax=Sphingomonas rubra TaxID=634430 RepID=A0A1I5RG86_9SPHN|nr:DUF533 domain-containing protein [Sphingomonas rubra]SFP57532.1 Protein of unknown function [Sphingomonas rubra]